MIRREKLNRDGCLCPPEESMMAERKEHGTMVRGLKDLDSKLVVGTH